MSAMGVDPARTRRPERPTATALSLHATGTGLRKERTEVLTLRAGRGAVGDRHAGRDPERALLVVAAASYDAIRGEGIDVPFGGLGENLVLGGVRAEDLVPGARLRTGGVELSLTAPCTVCRSLAQVHPRLPKVAYGRRGVYARVVRGGELATGAAIEVLPPPGPA